MPYIEIINNNIDQDTGKRKIPEWSILELQGEIFGGSYENQLLGEASIKNGKAEMKLGNHFLEGSVVKLKTPYLIMDSDDEDESIDNHIEDDEKDDNLLKKLKIKALIKSKIIFKTRPKPYKRIKIEPEINTSTN